MPFVINLIVSASVISFCVWLAAKSPSIAGFVISLPISTLLVLALNQWQHGETGNGVVLAKSIFVAIPMTLVFFIPFLLSDRWKIPFWVCYGSGMGLLVAAYFVHKYIFSMISK
ncbi:MAG: hypothetical protein KDD37_06185 [Bdellovibrionales bacterium]|nr:hypothetical protein [Bdellovibrionales bacterium]